MCGIVGFAGRPPIDRQQLTQMRDTLTHRGPDDAGLWISADGGVGLAQRRLAIIDLSAGGHQPMSDLAGRVHVSFNGEIYNFLELRRELSELGHRFQSASDTEVILAAYREWGEAFVSRLVGMFALSLYDEDLRALFLARDRAGEKPLFVWNAPNRLVFASELKALFALPQFPRRLSHEALNSYLAFGYVPQDQCMIEEVFKLRPGTIARYDVDRGSFQTWRYWDLPEFETRRRAQPANELVEELHGLLQSAVARQMVADVPIGILLSGGVDSSLITALAARASAKPVRTFTITFPGHGAFDEAPYARLVASHFGTEHMELEGEEAMMSLLPQLVRQYDEPLGDSSAFPTYLVSRLIRKHATVALGGDGGDELFGGYPQYRWIQRLAAVQRAIPSPLRELFGRTARALPVGTRGRNYLIAVGARGFDAVTRTSLFFDSEWRAALLTSGVRNGKSPEDLRLELASGAQSLLQAMLRIDFRSYMVDDILVKVDRASMLASLETRAPFLDPNVIEFAFARVPDNLKVSFRERKILLRRLAARVLPRELDLKRKQGFSVPLHAWFSGEWGPMMRSVLMDCDPRLFRREAIADLFSRQTRYGNQLARIYALTVFELWRREYDVAVA